MRANSGEPLTTAGLDLFVSINDDWSTLSKTCAASAILEKGATKLDAISPSRLFGDVSR